MAGAVSDEAIAHMDEQIDSGDEVARFLMQKLVEAKTILVEKEREIEPLRQSVRKLEKSLAEYQRAPGSQGVEDEDIVNYLRGFSEPMLAPQIAAGMGLDTRGLSRRLPRMVKHALLGGSPTAGYYAR